MSKRGGGERNKRGVGCCMPFAYLTCPAECAHPDPAALCTAVAPWLNYLATAVQLLGEEAALGDDDDDLCSDRWEAAKSALRDGVRAVREQLVFAGYLPDSL